MGKKNKPPRFIITINGEGKKWTYKVEEYVYTDEESDWYRNPYYKDGSKIDEYNLWGDGPKREGTAKTEFDAELKAREFLAWLETVESTKRKEEARARTIYVGTSEPASKPEGRR